MEKRSDKNSTIVQPSSLPQKRKRRSRRSRANTLPQLTLDQLGIPEILPSNTKMLMDFESMEIRNTNTHLSQTSIHMKLIGILMRSIFVTSTLRLDPKMDFLNLIQQMSQSPPSLSKIKILLWFLAVVILIM